MAHPPRTDPHTTALFLRLPARVWFSLGLIALVTLLIYGNIYDAPFVFDDQLQIVDNARIRDPGGYFSLPALRWPRVAAEFTFALNYAAGGLDVFGYHAVNVLIHMVNGFLVFALVSGLLAQLAASPPPGAGALRRETIPATALLAALVFVAHPVQTQAVTYTVQRYASLAACFYLAAVVSYVAARTRQQAPSAAQSAGRPGVWILYLLCGLCGVLAFLSKQNAASLPVAILLVEYLFFDRSWQGWRRKLLWLLPATALLAAAALYNLGLFSGQRVGLGTLLEDVSRLTGEAVPFSRWQYLCTQFNVLVVYLRLLFWPAGLNLDHGFPIQRGLFDGYTFPAFLLLLFLAALAVRNRNRRPVLTFAVLWFFITLSVESSIFPIRDALFEHRLYLPMLGLACWAAYTLFHLPRIGPLPAAALGGVLIVLLGGATHLRNGVWRDEVRLWRDAASKSPHHPRAHFNLGAALEKRGRGGQALQAYERTLQARPDHVRALTNSANLLSKAGKLDEALTRYRQALEIAPAAAEARTGLGITLAQKGDLSAAEEALNRALEAAPASAEVLTNLGKVVGRRGRLEEAAGHYRRALEADPDSVETLVNLGAVLARQGRPSEGEPQFRRALQLQPGHVGARFNLGLALAEQGKQDEALRALKETLRRAPDHAGARRELALAYARGGQLERAAAVVGGGNSAEANYNLGVLLGGSGHLPEAIAAFEQALRLEPDSEETRINLGVALARQGDPGGAMEQFEAVLRVNPRSEGAHVNQALALEQRGEVVPALNHFVAAVSINPDSPAAREGIRRLSAKLGSRPPATGGRQKAAE